MDGQVAAGLATLTAALGGAAAHFGPGVLGHRNGNGTRATIRWEEELRATMAVIKEAVVDGRNEHVSELHAVRLGLESAAAGLSRVVDKMDETAQAQAKVLERIEAALPVKRRAR